MAIIVRSLRRYPVKSMGGGALERVEVDRRGLLGDRWYAVTDADGKLASGKNSRRFRRRDAVFEHAASTRPDGTVEVSRGVERWSVGTPDLDAALTQSMGAAVRVLPEERVPHQDGGQVSLIGSATLDWFRQEWGIDADPRRLRVNLVVETEQPFVEETWVGQVLAIGETRLLVDERIPRCRMIDLAQDGATADGRWLTPLSLERDMCAAVYLLVDRPGAISVGDPVEVRPPSSAPDRSR